MNKKEIRTLIKDILYLYGKDLKTLNEKFGYKVNFQKAYLLTDLSLTGYLLFEINEINPEKKIEISILEDNIYYTLNCRVIINTKEQINKIIGKYLDNDYTDKGLRIIVEEITVY